MTGCDPTWLNDLRTLLIVGLFATVILFALLNAGQPRKPATVEHCKLHSCPLGSCPPESHDE